MSSPFPLLTVELNYIDPPFEVHFSDQLPESLEREMQQSYFSSNRKKGKLLAFEPLKIFSFFI